MALAPAAPWLPLTACRYPRSLSVCGLVTAVPRQRRPTGRPHRTHSVSFDKRFSFKSATYAWAGNKDTLNRTLVENGQVASDTLCVRPRSGDQNAAMLHRTRGYSAPHSTSHSVRGGGCRLDEGFNFAGAPKVGARQKRRRGACFWGLGATCVVARPAET